MTNLSGEVVKKSFAPFNAPAIDSDLGQAIEKSFGDFDTLYFYFKASISKIEHDESDGGSSYCSLVYNKTTNLLEITNVYRRQKLFNQQDELVPLMLLKTYKYGNSFDPLIKIWKNVNWDKVAERYHAATQSNCCV